MFPEQVQARLRLVLRTGKVALKLRVRIIRRRTSPPAPASTRRPASSLRLGRGRVLDPDLEQLRPVFARDVDLVRRLVVGDPVQHVRPAPVFGREDTAKIDDARDGARRRINPHDAISLKDVRPDSALDEFQLVDLVDRPPVQLHIDAAGLLQRHRIQLADPGLCHRS